MGTLLGQDDGLDEVGIVVSWDDGNEIGWLEGCSNGKTLEQHDGNADGFTDKPPLCQNVGIA